MKSIETVASFTADGTLTAKIPAIISPGEHQVVIVIEEAKPRSVIKARLQDRTSKPKPGEIGETKEHSPMRVPLNFSAYPVGLIADDFTFRREDIYDDGI